MRFVCGVMVGWGLGNGFKLWHLRAETAYRAAVGNLPQWP